MAKIKIQDLSFSYATGSKEALSHISMEIEEGDFVLIFGKSGSGKSTLLKMLKKEISPYGKTTGSIWIEGKSIDEVDTSVKVGFVMQNIENQLVTDKVWHELAFGLENLNTPMEEMRIRVAENCYFFDLQDIFEKEVSKLSGGEKELALLASVMLMRPDILILDEPLSKLDPTVKRNLLNYLKKIHEELGTTIVVAEHDLREVISLANKVVVMEEGKIDLQGKKEDVIKAILPQKKYLSFLPLATRLPNYFKESKVLYHIGDARNYLKSHLTQKEMVQALCEENAPCALENSSEETVLLAKEIWFRYAKEEQDILKGCSICLKKGEVYTLLAGNGCGKTTLLNCLLGILKPYAGKIEAKQKIVMLPQNPKTLFCHHTVKEELSSVSKDQERIQEIVDLFQLSSILEAHPFDISGGEEERLGLAKVFLTDAEVFCLDEPTKGIDALMNQKLKEWIKRKSLEGKTFLIVTHDLEFASFISHRLGMLFNGKIIAENDALSFFEQNEFYTTDLVKISRHIVPLTPSGIKEESK